MQYNSPPPYFAHPHLAEAAAKKKAEADAKKKAEEESAAELAKRETAGRGTCQKLRGPLAERGHFSEVTRNHSLAQRFVPPPFFTSPQRRPPATRSSRAFEKCLACDSNWAGDFPTKDPQLHFNLVKRTPYSRRKEGPHPLYPQEFQGLLFKICLAYFSG